MKPYYEHAGVTIFCGDCLELLPTLTSDVLVTDPPYGIDMEAFADEIETASMGVDAAQGHRAAIFASPRTLPDFWKRVETWSWERLLWLWKDGDIAHPWRGWHMNSEAIIIASRTREGWPAYDSTRSDCYRVGFSGGKNGHPAAKPLSVVSDLVARLSRPTDVILDPFAGSGTTLVAAKNLGRRAIGIEIEERYCEIAAKRLSQEVMQFGAGQ